MNIRYVSWFYVLATQLAAKRDSKLSARRAMNYGAEWACRWARGFQTCKPGLRVWRNAKRPGSLEPDRFAG